MTGYSVVGKGVPIDGPEKVIGKAIFTLDVTTPGMLYGKILSSANPHARKTDAAVRLPGVKAVITGRDMVDIKYAFVDTPRYPADEYPIAVDKVRYIGDKVTAVAADSEAIAEEALSLIKVEYEILPAVFKPEEAMKSDAPFIHEEQLAGSSAWEECHGFSLPIRRVPNYR